MNSSEYAFSFWLDPGFWNFDIWDPGLSSITTTPTTVTVTKRVICSIDFTCWFGSNERKCQSSPRWQQRRLRTWRQLVLSSQLISTSGQTTIKDLWTLFIEHSVFGCSCDNCHSRYNSGSRSDNDDSERTGRSMPTASGHHNSCDAGGNAYKTEQIVQSKSHGSHGPIELLVGKVSSLVKQERIKPRCTKRQHLMLLTTHSTWWGWGIRMTLRKMSFIEQFSSQSTWRYPGMFNHNLCLKKMYWPWEHVVNPDQWAITVGKTIRRQPSAALVEFWNAMKSLEYLGKMRLMPQTLRVLTP